MNFPKDQDFYHSHIARRAFSTLHSVKLSTSNLSDITKSVVLITVAVALFWSSWPPEKATPLIFCFAFPLFLLENIFLGKKNGNLKFMLAILIFHILSIIITTRWLYDTNMFTSAMVHFLNSLYLSIPWLFYVLFSEKIRVRSRLLIWISSLLVVEYIHYHWFLSFPFLTLGNAFAMRPSWVQFYEYTGIFGGSLWILVINALIYLVFNKALVSKRLPTIELIWILALITVPLVSSILTFRNYEEKGKSLEVIAVHPNVDCRNEKYSIPQDSLISKYLDITNSSSKAGADFILWPETAIPNLDWTHKMGSNKDLQTIFAGLGKFKNAKLVTGAILYEITKDKTNANTTFQKKSGSWYKTFNSAVQLDLRSGGMQMRVKQKLVPVEETIPLGVSFLRRISPSLGGFKFSSKAKQKETFHNKNGNQGSLPLICYESLYGEFAASQITSNVEVIFVLLNEGWYKNILGASQFMYYSALRAIETRRSIARSSNDGITCFINQKGEIEKSVSDFSPDVLHGTLKTNSKVTFYSKAGDYIGIIAAITLAIALAYHTLFNKTNLLII